MLCVGQVQADTLNRFTFVINNHWGSRVGQRGPTLKSTCFQTTFPAHLIMMTE
jgi:hypothetical protein